MNLKATFISASIILLVFGSFFYGLYWLSTLEFSTLVDVSPIPDQELTLSSLQDNIEALKSYLQVIEPSREPLDYIRKLKGYTFVGYLMSLVEERFPRTTVNKTAWSLETVSYFETSIELYRKRLLKVPEAVIDAEMERRIMYFVYLKQSRTLFLLSQSKDALNNAEWAVKLASTAEEEASALAIQGDVLVALGEVETALTVYNRAIALKPHDLSFIRDIVMCHKYTGNLSKNKWRLLFLESEARLLLTESQECIDEKCKSKARPERRNTAPPINQEGEKQEQQKDPENGVKSDEDEDEDDERPPNEHIDGSEVFTDSRYSQFTKMKGVVFPAIVINHTAPIHGSEAVFQGLFEAAEMAGMYKDAWHYLERRKKVSLRELETSSGYALNLEMTKEMAQARYVFETFHKDFWPAKNATLRVGSSSRVPVFIIGMMRSGSTLLESMLFAHPEILSIGEESVLVPHVHRFVAALPSLNGESRSISGDDIEDGDDESDWEYEININANRATRAGTPDTAATTLDGAINERAEKVVQDMISNARRIFNYTSKYRENQSTKHVIDKMLLNYMNIGFIHLFFPNALIIHIVRDPLDTAVSCYRMNFGNPNLAWTMTLDSLFNGFRIYLEVIAHFKRVLPKRVHEVQYELLIKNPERELRKILNRLGTFVNDSL